MFGLPGNVIPAIYIPVILITDMYSYNQLNLFISNFFFIAHGNQSQNQNSQLIPLLWKIVGVVSYFFFTVASSESFIWRFLLK